MTDDRRWVVEGEAEPLDLAQLSAAHAEGRLAGKSVRLQGREVDLTVEDLATLEREAQGQLNLTAPPSMAEYPRMGGPSVSSAPTDSNEDPMRFVVPVNPSIWAVAAGYLGILSLACIPAPFAIIFGIIALNDLKKNPNKTGKGRAVFGIVAGSVALLFLGFVLIMAAMTPKASGV